MSHPRSKIRELEILGQDSKKEHKMDESDCEIARLTRIAEQTKEHISETQWYNLDERTAGWDALQICRPTGAATPAHSHAGSDCPKLDIDCDAKVDIKG